MPQIGPLEILVVSVIALIVFGPQRLPEIARTVGRAVNEFRRQAADIKSQFESGIEDDEDPDPPAQPVVHRATPRSHDERSVDADDPDAAAPVEGEEGPEGHPT